MATLVGRDTLTANYENYGGDLRYAASGYTGTAGDITSLKVRVRDGTAGHVRLAIYNAVGVLLRETASTAFTPSGTAQTVTGSITSLTLIASTYYLGFQFDGFIDVDVNAGSFANDGTGQAYGAFPATITIPTSGDFALAEVAVWGDGTAGGGGGAVKRNNLMLFGLGR